MFYLHIEKLINLFQLRLYQIENMEINSLVVNIMIKRKGMPIDTPLKIEILLFYAEAVDESVLFELLFAHSEFVLFGLLHELSQAS